MYNLWGLAQKPAQISPVLGLSVMTDILLQLVRRDETAPQRDLFGTADLHALALLDGGDILARLKQAVWRAGVEPGETAPKRLHR